MYTFEKRNIITKKIAKAEFFMHDKRLYLERCNNPRLIKDISRANEFTYQALDARMVYELLGVVSEQDVLNNRIQPLTPTVTSSVVASVEKDITKKKVNTKSSLVLNGKKILQKTYNYAYSCMTNVLNSSIK